MRCAAAQTAALAMVILIGFERRSAGGVRAAG